MAEQNPEVTTRIPLDEVEKAASLAAEQAVHELLFGDRDAPQGGTAGPVQARFTSRALITGLPVPKSRLPPPMIVDARDAPGGSCSPVRYRQTGVP
jgi:hypothetical protein